LKGILIPIYERIPDESIAFYQREENTAFVRFNNRSNFDIRIVRFDGNEFCLAPLDKRIQKIFYLTLYKLCGPQYPDYEFYFPEDPYPWYEMDINEFGDIQFLYGGYSDYV